MRARRGAWTLLCSLTVRFHRSHHWTFGSFVLLVCVCAGLACATSPTGRRQLILVPDVQMDALGQEAFTQIRREEPVERDPAINNHVACVAAALIGRLASDVEWEILVFDDDQMVNAFALPGGRIGIYTGILDVADTQGKLAALIGHEMGHVLARHGSERVSQHVALGVGMEALAAAMSETQTRGLLLGALGLGAQVGVLLPYSRRHESEADIIGQDLMADAGFDPRDSVALWEAMQEAATGAAPPDFLSTHPSPQARIQRLHDNLRHTLPLYEAAQAAGRRPRCPPRLTDK